MHSKYEAKQHTVMIDSNYDVHCIESSTYLETNKKHVNPAEMTCKTKVLMLKHQ